MRAAPTLPDKPATARRSPTDRSRETIRRARPAPLFPVAIAFAVGVAAGTLGFVPFWIWLPFFFAAAILWMRKSAAAADGVRSFISFLLLVVAAGAFHSAVRDQIVRPDDLRLLPDSKYAETAVWRGRIAGNPRFQDRASRRGTSHAQFPFAITGWRDDGNAIEAGPWQSAHGTIQVRIKQAAENQFHYGDELVVSGPLADPPGPRNPGEFNDAGWLMRHDIYYELNATASNIRKLSADRDWPWMTLATRMREWALSRLQLGLEDDPLARAILAGIVIGDIENIPPPVENAFRETNTFHIFAVSGQDVAVVLAVGLGALQAAGLLRWRWAWLLAPMLIMYCLLTGAQPSAVRAVMMALLVLIAWLCGRPVSTLNLWSMAALLALGWDPKLIGNLSFQFSFGVVLALVLLTGPIFRLLQPLYAPDPFLLPALKSPLQRAREWILRTVVALMASSLAAWIGSFPFMIWYFHQVSPIGLLANLIIVPLASLIVVIGAISLFSSIFSSGFAVLLNNTNWLFIKLMVAIVTLFSHVPYGNFFVPDGSVDWRPADPEFVCADMRGTTAALIRDGGHAWLLETGDDHTFRSVINPLRQFYGVNRFDSVILPEISARAAGGSAQLAQMPIKTEWISPPSPDGKKPPAFLQLLRDTLATKNKALTHWHQGDQFTLAPDFTVKVLAPFENEQARRAEDQALVLLFTYHGQTLLWAGDISFGTEQRLIRAWPDLHAEILLEAKNRNEPNLSPEWLHQLAPKEIILPATPFGHSRSQRSPVDDWPADSPRPRVWQQDDTGALTIKLRPDGWEIQPFLMNSPLVKDGIDGQSQN